MSLLVVGSVLAGEAAEPPAYELVEVSDSVVMAFNSNGSNIACVALDQGLLFVDASLSTRVAERFRRDMEAPTIATYSPARSSSETSRRTPRPANWREIPAI